MKRILALIGLICNLSSCQIKSEKSSPEIGKLEASETVQKIATKNKNTSIADSVMLGIWQGDIKGKNLNIVFEKIDGDSVFGFTNISGKKRLINGIIVESAYDIPCSKAFEANLYEPGDEKWDGVFTIKFVGFEEVKEGENGPECAGNLKGREAMGEWKSCNGGDVTRLHLNKLN